MKAGKTEIKFTTHKIEGVATEKATMCRCVLMHNKKVPRANLARDMASAMHIDEIEAERCLSLVERYVTQSLGEGKRLDFGSFALGLSMTGKVKGSKGAFEEGRNEITVHIKAGGNLRAALAELVPVNATPVDPPRVKRIMDASAKIDGEIALGERILVSGTGLKVNLEAEDEGVWLESLTGESLLCGIVQHSTNTTIDCRFEGTLEPGEYRFVLYSRNGLPSSSSVMPSSRKVILRG